MKPVSLRFLPGFGAVVTAAAVSLAVATVVEAQTPPAPRSGDARPPMAPGGPKMEHGEHGPGMRMMRELERFRTSLALNPQQAALWDRAAALMKPEGELRGRMKERHDRMAAMLDDPNFDPRKLAAEMDRAEGERKAKMTSVRDAWFAVYDVLNPAQRGQVREFLRQRMSRGHHDMRGGRGGEWMHRGDGKGSTPPAPPAASATTR